MELYNALVQILVATSKTKLDIQCNKHGIRVTSRVAEQLKTQDLRKLGNIGKISNFGRHIAQRPVSVPEIKLWKQQSKSTHSRYQTFLYLSNFRFSGFEPTTTQFVNVYLTIQSNWERSSLTFGQTIEWRLYSSIELQSEIRT